MGKETIKETEKEQKQEREVSWEPIAWHFPEKRNPRCQLYVAERSATRKTACNWDFTGDLRKVVSSRVVRIETSIHTALRRGTSLDKC